MNLVKMDDILSAQSVMAVTLQGSTSSDQPLNDQQLNTVISLCQEAMQLDDDRLILLRYIESRMLKMAPNLSALIGTHITAKLVSQVGGLRALSVMPACNIMLVGQQRQKTITFDASVRHTGFLFDSDIVQDAPKDLRIKASRVLANKVTLAARIDAQGVKSNDQGCAYRKEIQEKIEKWQEPSMGMRQKPLPVPGDGPKKKRGGRR